MWARSRASLCGCASQCVMPTCIRSASFPPALECGSLLPPSKTLEYQLGSELDDPRGNPLHTAAHRAERGRPDITVHGSGVRVEVIRQVEELGPEFDVPPLGYRE